MKHIVTLPYSLLEPAVAWAKANCPGYITNSTHIDDDWYTMSNRIDFFFVDEKNANWFSLRWK